MKKVILLIAVLAPAISFAEESSYQEANQYIECANVYSIYYNETSDESENSKLIVGTAKLLAIVTSSEEYVEAKSRESLLDEYKKRENAKALGATSLYTLSFLGRLKECDQTISSGQVTHKSKMLAYIGRHR